MSTTLSEIEGREIRTNRVSRLYGEITAATREFLRAVAEVDRHEDWREEGFGSCGEWLAVQIGITVGPAREWVRTARALEQLPAISDAMDRGRVSFSKVRALTRVATPENEEALLEYAKAGSAATLERLVRGWKTLGREAELGRERVRLESRTLSAFQDNSGMYVVRGLLTPEVGALLMRAIEAAGDALFRECPDDDPAQRRADAVGLLAERALAAGFGAEDAPVSGSRAERYQVMLHVEPATLAEDGEPGTSELEDGTRVSAETSRRISCDASRVDLGVGRKTRTVSPSVRRALEARDRGCRFPGCGLRFTDAHHIVHWADGGDTKLGNLVLLCARHHRAVHEGGFRVCSDTEGQVVFFTPEGNAFGGAAPPPRLGPDPVTSLIRYNRDRFVRPDEWSCGQRWNDAFIPDDLEVAALEALDP